MNNTNKVTALICECNPFHEGHKRIIDKAKENGNLLVCIMSPDFVQRGEPAVYDKYKRATVLLENGADLVVELPVEYALSSARYFAKAGVYIAHKLGFVDTIIFGSFINDYDKLKDIAYISSAVFNEYENNSNKLQTNNKNKLNTKKLKDDLTHYNKHIKEYLQKGMSYPKALSMGLGIDLKSNDILNIEYLHALQELKSKINPIVFERKKDIQGASDIRQNMKDVITIDDFSDYLNQILFYNNKNEVGFIDYYGVDESFNNSLMNIATKNMSYSERAEILATKNRTMANVKRNLLHILLGIKKNDMIHKNYFSKYNYIHILGFNNNGKNLINKIQIPYLLGYTKKELDRFDRTYYNHNINRSIQINIYASDLYQYVLRTEEYEMSRKVIKI